MMSQLDKELPSKRNQMSDTYYAERIVGKRHFQKKLQYSVKWLNWDSKYNTWEPISHLSPDCDDLIEDYELRCKRKRKRTSSANGSNSKKKTPKFIAEQEPEKEKDESEEVEYVVKKVVGKRLRSDNDVEYLVEWEGYDKSQDTWEPMKNLQGCAHLIESFEKELKEKSRKPTEKTEFDKGWQAEKIIGATHIDDDMKFLIKWKRRKEPNLVSSKVARYWIPQMIIKFYEEHRKYLDD